MNGKQSSPHDSPPPAGHTARPTAASNTLNSGTAVGDQPIVERNESTPNAFAPGDSTPVDNRDGPQWLINLMSRLISATCETLQTGAHSTPASLPGTVAERNTPMRTRNKGSTPDLPETDSTRQRPTNRDTHPL